MCHGALLRRDVRRDFTPATQSLAKAKNRKFPERARNRLFRATMHCDVFLADWHL